MRERTYQEVVTTARDDALGQDRGATDREAVDMAEARAFVARQLGRTGRRSGSATPKTRCCASSTWPTASATRRGAARLRDQREVLARRLGRLCRRRLQPFLGRPHLGAQRQYRARAGGGLHRTDPRPRLLPDPVGPFAAERQRGVRRARLDRTHQGQVRRARRRRQARGDPEQARYRRRPHALALAQRHRGRQRARGTALPDGEDQARAFKLYGTYNLKDNLSITGELPVRALRLAGLAARRHRPGDRPQPARARRAAAELFAERVPGRAALPVLSLNLRAAARARRRSGRSRSSR